ncbi:tumor necrosis factor receptor superfamily member 6B-like [Arapaima gigas]
MPPHLALLYGLRGEARSGQLGLPGQEYGHSDATMLLGMLSLVLFVGGTDSASPPTTTYKHSDPTTGRMLTCDRCPPGSYRRKHCNGNGHTLCAPCPQGYFTEYWNYLGRCLYCNAVCGENQVVTEECSPVRNRRCECKDGYYLYFDLCRRHTVCSSGYGVKVKGNASQNTVCEKCPRGTYAGGSSQAKCTNHTDCASLGLLLVLRGSQWHDNLCASCEDLQAGGGLKLLQGILPDFFSFQNISTNKLQRFVKKSLLRGSKGIPAVRDLLAYITEWCKRADVAFLHLFSSMPAVDTSRQT